ncbi:hypothetical protein NEFER03_1432 [Nematocida sp. LUAm3]|nr:hypothetical protein NEFER03_1432 [Nematocida sp. LUAm3]KAI5174738.1 hypothetical protein NEFER02_0848 [Nematocida sp. LUAm2]KAI5177851.1 hypothetical protein NEFER01_1053 [Nematocida sp. LUAm1]
MNSLSISIASRLLRRFFRLKEGEMNKEETRHVLRLLYRCAENAPSGKLSNRSREKSKEKRREREEKQSIEKAQKEWSTKEASSGTSDVQVNNSKNIIKNTLHNENIEKESGRTNIGKNMEFNREGKINENRSASLFAESGLSEGLLGGTGGANKTFSGDFVKPEEDPLDSTLNGPLNNSFSHNPMKDSALFQGYKGLEALKSDSNGEKNGMFAEKEKKEDGSLPTYSFDVDTSKKMQVLGAGVSYSFEI